MAGGIGRWPGRAWWVGAGLLSAAVALVSYRYLARGDFLSPDILANLFANPWLDVHVAGAATALLLGSLQFVPALRRRFGAHRWIGRAYVVSCLAGGVGGLVLAFGTTAGPIATAGFASLAVIWIGVNALGWRAAMAGEFAEHRRWMIRSWALTLSAVTLRVYIVVGPLLGVPMSVAYVASSFLAWVPNLIVAELWLRGAFGVWGRGGASSIRAGTSRAPIGRM